MKSGKAVLWVVVSMSCVQIASAQQLHTNSTEILSLRTGQPQPADCSDFMRNVDGSWQSISPLITKSGGRQNLSRNILLFHPNAPFNDLDVVGALEKSCNK
jgi:hypothetical protein